MLKLLRNSKVQRGIAVYFSLSLLFEILSPTVALALTSGPAQEEFASFEPASTTDMVDLYSGDYNYNIPLLSVPGPNGGYPINLAYHSGIGMEQEASWVGLGWTLNVGAINRNLRGLPDDFNGDNIKKTQYIKDNITASLDMPLNDYRERMGFPISTNGNNSGTNLQVYYNNYRGLGMRYTFSASRVCESAPSGLNISFDSQNGMGIGLNFDAGKEFAKANILAGFGLGLNYNSRQGLQSLNFTSSVKYSGKNIGAVGNSKLSFATVFGIPKTNMSTKSTTVPFTLKIKDASHLFKFKSNHPISGSVYTSKVENNGVENIGAQGYINTSGQGNVLKDFSRQEIAYSKKVPHLATSSFTYDLYTQTGQGTGSMFRPYLNTFGVLSDPKKVNKDRVLGGGLEVGVGSGFILPPVIHTNYSSVHIGVDFEYGSGENSSGPWTQINDGADWGQNLGNLRTWQSENNKIDYEPYYFQVIGEKTGHHAEEDQLADNLGKDLALRFKLEKEKHDNSWLGRHFKATDDLLHEEWEASLLTPPPYSLTGSNQTKQKSTQKRAKRSTSIEPLTTSQANLYGFSKNITYTDASGTGSPILNTAKDFTKPSHHISEISMLQADGMRYVYGLPAYNNSQAENLFAVDQSPKNNNGADDIINGSEVIVNGGTTGGINVKSTFNEFVSKTELPQYAHSWLLTSLLSADYLDVTGNGPTEDDFGYWVKFNYKKTATNFKWRIPYTKANFLDGLKNELNDNKGTYTYGTKDIYVLESIETKTHISVFETSNRKDGIEAYSEYSNGYPAENNGRGTQTMKKLDKIKLFTKREYAKPIPIPTKVINLEYSYDLCPEVPNNNRVGEIVSTTNANGERIDVNLNQKNGKLTLKKIYFTYQNSLRGKMSPYVFNYGDINSQQDNPDYNKQNMDRWGNFKNTKKFEYSSGNATVITYPFTDHPYTEQDPEYYTSNEAQALKPAQWTLKQISLPTGGTLTMEYEPDDYAYVENKQAMRMFDICGLSKPGITTSISELANAANRKRTPISIPTEAGSFDGGNNKVYFKLEKSIDDLISQLNLPSNLSAPEKSDLFRKVYLDNIPGGYVYFNTMSNITNGTYDNVKGYAEIDLSQYGIVPGSWSNPDTGIEEYYGYFTLKNKKLASPVNITGLWVSPFTLAAIQHLRADRPNLMMEATGYSANPAGSAMDQINNLVAAIPANIQDLMSTVTGFNNYAYAKGWGRDIQLNGYSTIRLCEPDYQKIGGGVRVKKITLNDNWKNDPSNTTAQNSLYGQEYEYTKTATVDGNKITISSGVAYEPQVGSEESALKSPIPYKNSIPLSGSYNLFMENPIMDSYYPGAGVGYSKVTVKSIAPERASAEDPTPGTPNNLIFSAAPITISEFYTPKDFPVVFDKTDMNPGQPIRIPIMIPGIMTNFTTRQAKSQGYSIILNDMAGKPKAVTVKTRNGNQVISRQKFVYNTEQSYNEDAENRLSDKVQTLEIDDDNKIKYITSIVGQSHDIFIDMNEDAQKVKSFGLQTNFDFELDFTPPVPPSIPLPLFMIMVLPSIKIDESSMRTIVLNKVINRTGILKKVETTTNESTITTENLAFDIETGEPILTKVTNEFKDPVFNLNYPGHWYYPNMEGAYQNFGLTTSVNATSALNGIPLSSAVLNSTVSNPRKVSDYFAKGDLVKIVCTATSSQNDGEYHVFNIDDATNSILLINSSGNLFPPGIFVQSLKVLKSGFKNMQSTKVGSLVFKAMDSNFKDFVPTDPTTEVTTLNAPPNGLTLVFENATNNGPTVNNKIISASAVEYSDDWQVFCGPKLQSQEECVCGLNQEGYDFLAMLQSLHTDNLVLGRGVPMYDLSHDTYFNGFTSNLLNSNGQLLSLMNSLSTISGSVMLYYNAFVRSNGELWILFNNVDSGAELNLTDSQIDAKVSEKPACVVKLHSANGNIWNSIGSFNDIQILPDERTCAPGEILLKGINKNDNSVMNISLTVKNSCFTHCLDCWKFANCYTKLTPNYACGIQPDDEIDPYWAGLKGMWRPKASYAYNTTRQQSNNIKEDGIYNDYVRFPWEAPATKNAKWINASTVTKYSPFGFELENKDALENYSSALYGYKQSLVTAIGSNAKYNEIAFDNFEDYPLDCNDKHFKFTDFAGSVISGNAHTGKYSIRVLPGDRSPDIQTGMEPIVLPGRGDNCLGVFAPKPNKKYVASVWVRETATTHLNTMIGAVNYTAPKLKITVTTTTSPIPGIYIFSTKGNVIDGWQQIFESFDIPATATGIKVELVNTSSNTQVYFDDIRIHPFDGNMISYVYDPITLKKMAELDANNYATIYVYDDEGHLNKVKKETIEGIKTIKEGRVNAKKINE